MIIQKNTKCCFKDYGEEQKRAYSRTIEELEENGISNLGYETLRNFNETQNRISDCCCTTQRGIDGVNYNGAINTANINANTTAQTQKILDALSQNKIESLQAQVTQLQLQNAMCGVVRYPNATTYCSGSNPFGNCGCGNAI